MESLYSVRLGVYNVCKSESSQKEYKVIKVLIHELYPIKSPYYDICLLTLDKNTDEFLPACLPIKGKCLIICVHYAYLLIYFQIYIHIFNIITMFMYKTTPYYVAFTRHTYKHSYSLTRSLYIIIAFLLSEKVRVSEKKCIIVVMRKFYPSL